MNESEKKAWEELVEWFRGNPHVNRNTILAADAELTALREENRRMNDALKEACQWIVGSGNAPTIEEAMRSINAILYPDRRRAGKGDG